MKKGSQGDITGVNDIIGNEIYVTKNIL